VSKVRVYELAKELGLESKELLAKLQEVGEFVRSASSTVEAPVLRKLMDKFPELTPSQDAPKAKKAPAKKAAAKKEAAKPLSVEDLPLELQEAAKKLVAEQPKINPAIPVVPVTPVAPTSAAPTSPTSPTSMPRPPRAGNNPFSSGASMPRPPARPIRPGEQRLAPGQRPPTQGGARGPGQRGDMQGSRPGSVRPGFAARPQSGAPGQRPGGALGARPQGNSPYRTPSSTTPGAGSPFAGKGGGRPPQRGGAAGAFGKGGKSK